MNEVELTLFELTRAAHVGVSRVIDNFNNKRRPRYGETSRNSVWEEHIIGAIGECAVAKYFNLYWNGSLGDIHAKDVGKFQVRTRAREIDNLLLHPEDKDEDIFIAVIVSGRIVKIAGWIFGSNGKKPRFWAEKVKGRPCYFVPNSALKPMENLIP